MDIRVTNQLVPVTSRTSFTGSVFEVIFLIIVIIVAYFYLVSPKQTQFSDLKNKLTDVKKRQESIKSQKIAFDKLVQDLEDETEGVEALDQTLPIDSKPSKIYVLLENLMQRQGLTTGSVSVDADSQQIVAGHTETGGQALDSEHKVQPVPLTVSATGTIDQLNGFLQFVETSTRLLEVVSLDVNQGQADQLVFRIGMRAYFYGETLSKSGTVN